MNRYILPNDREVYLNKIIHLPLEISVIEYLATLILDCQGENNNKDFSDIVCVFPGQRPKLFLRRKLSELINDVYIPPKIFSWDEFINWIFFSQEENLDFRGLKELDAGYIIYQLCKKIIPELTQKRESFQDFLPWAYEIYSFLQQVDLEDIQADKLKNIERSAAIGYDIPPFLNNLLAKLSDLHSCFNKELKKRQLVTKTMKLKYLVNFFSSIEFFPFKHLFLADFYYLHYIEKIIFKKLLKRKIATLIFQGDTQSSVLKDNFSFLGKEIIKLPDIYSKVNLTEKINFYRGENIHAQLAGLKEIILNIKGEKLEDTLVVLPRPEAVVPLVSILKPIVKDFNISLGYPITRTPFFLLCQQLFKTQLTRKKNSYYLHDYLALIHHPFIKNMVLFNNANLTRAFAYKLEEIFQDKLNCSLSGKLFFSLTEVEEDPVLIEEISVFLDKFQETINRDYIKLGIKSLNDFLFRRWEGIKNIEDFADSFMSFIDELKSNNQFIQYIFNEKSAQQLYNIAKEMKESLCAREQMDIISIWRIFLQRSKKEKIPFIGSPLKGLQILGMLETRSLNFKNVIILDLNESVYPHLKVNNPFIPRDIMLQLGINRLEKEEEIQRYYFRRLIHCADNVYLIYQDTDQEEKSRFLEELIWEKEKKEKNIGLLNIPKFVFSVGIEAKTKVVEKNEQMIQIIQQQPFSATRLDLYLRCPLRFYYQYVLQLSTRNIIEDDPDAGYIGDFLHRLLEKFYAPFIGKIFSFNKTKEKKFFNLFENMYNSEIAPRVKSGGFLLKRIMVHRLGQFIKAETERPSFKILSLEQQRLGEIQLARGKYNFVYKIDRIDQEDGKIVVIDYKSGGEQSKLKKKFYQENLILDRHWIRDNLGSFQLPLYYYFVKNSFQKEEIDARFYYLRTCQQDSFLANIKPKDQDKFMANFQQALQFIISEIYDLNFPFYPDISEECKKYCPFVLGCF